MPKGYPKSPKPYVGPNENLQRLLDMQVELQERINAEKHKDKARDALLNLARVHNLTAADLRAVAKILGDRKVGDAPVTSKKIMPPRPDKKGKMIEARKLKPAKGKDGQAVRKGRLALNLTTDALGVRIGRNGTAITMWERGHNPIPDRMKLKLAEVLNVPIDSFTPLKNGVAHAAE